MIRVSLPRTVARVIPLSLLLPIVALGCSRDQGAKATPDGSKAQTNAVTVAPVEARDVQRRVEIVGSIEPDEEITVYAQVSGYVEKILADLGDRVNAGQPLIQLDQADFRLQVQRVEAILRQTQAKLGAVDGKETLSDDQQSPVRQAKASSEDAALWYERMQSLYKEGAVSRNDVDTARAKRDALKATLDGALDQVRSLRDQLKEQQALLDLARRNLGYTVIRAPIDGSIKQRDVSVGQYIAGGSMQNTKLLVMVRDDPLKLKASVPERFQGQIRPGQEVKLQVEAYSGRDFTGMVTRVGPAVFSDTRTFPIEARIPNKQGLLKPGSFAKARVQIRVDRGVAFVPEEAVYYFVGITKAFVVKDGVVEERQVKAGERQDGLVEIVEGVASGEMVATSRLSQLFGGATVQVVK
ncbi:MAG: efflux RND transporter periplasmic adaptor subunit [candidate division NC10 bacterium]|nr:efflux RND transporter periplasmic adaptor subunit [candidate division NC10 bacterium]